MKNSGYAARAQRLAGATGVGLVLVFAPQALAQGSGAPSAPPALSPISPTSPSVPPEIMKPGVRASEADNPEALFKKLDVGQRGYLTPAETRDLLGFNEAFKAADGGSGRLTLTQFKKAWAMYKAKQ